MTFSLPFKIGKWQNEMHFYLRREEKVRLLIDTGARRRRKETTYGMEAEDKGRVRRGCPVEAEDKGELGGDVKLRPG